MVDWDKMRVVKGPSLVRNLYICRVVGDHDPEVVGSGIWVEGWTGNNWTSYADGLPSMNEVMASPLAELEVLREANIPEDPWPENYEPPEPPDFIFDEEEDRK